MSKKEITVLSTWFVIVLIFDCAVLVAPFLRQEMKEYSNTFLYFFSSLAQSAAAFAALVAVFATFRLQVSSSMAEKLFDRAVSWLVEGGVLNRNDSRDPMFIKKKLSEIIKGQHFSGNTEKEQYAQNLSNQISLFETFQGDMGNRLSEPLKLWLWTFLLSLIAILVFHFSIARSVGSLAGVSISLAVLTVYSVWKSGKFIQDCLSD